MPLMGLLDVSSKIIWSLETSARFLFFELGLGPYELHSGAHVLGRRRQLQFSYLVGLCGILLLGSLGLYWNYCSIIFHFAYLLDGRLNWQGSRSLALVDS